MSLNEDQEGLFFNVCMNNLGGSKQKGIVIDMLLRSPIVSNGEKIL